MSDIIKVMIYAPLIPCGLWLGYKLVLRSRRIHGEYAILPCACWIYIGATVSAIGFMGLASL